MDNEKISLKMCRKNARLKQKVVAELLNVTSQTINNWENGRTVPPMDYVLKMSELYNVPIQCITIKRAKKHFA